jgi:DNA-directed RNA polymerase I subunit RPA49
LIPQYDADALNPCDVYPLHNMIPKPEWKALYISAYMNADNSADRVALLPYKRSNWINDHLSLAFASPSPNKTTMCVDISFITRAHYNADVARKTLVYIAAMMAFHKSTFKNIDKTVLQQKLAAVPTVVIDGLLSRFTETARGSMEYVHPTLLVSAVLTAP